MSQAPVMLPLFPLNTVLFPGCTLDLQLFEPRYLEMLDDVMSGDRLIGIVQPAPGAGHEEEIISILKKPEISYSIKIG